MECYSLKIRVILHASGMQYSSQGYKRLSLVKVIHIITYVKIIDSLT